MTESTVRAERFEPQSSAPTYIWTVPQKPISVRIPFPLIDRLDHEVVESFRSLHSRGSEIGGFLLGRVPPGNLGAISIEDYQLIECDYSRGPLYRLSDADMGRLERAMEQRPVNGGLVVVGFFRSHTRKGVALDADDLALMKARFSESRQVALLIRPFATKASTAGIFIWEDGTMRGDASYLEFAFRSSELTASKPVEATSPPVQEVAQAAAPEAAAPKPAARGQIVPIASRREPAPPAFVEVPPAEMVPEKKPEPAVVAPAPAPTSAPAPAPAAVSVSAPAPAPVQEDKASGAMPSAPVVDTEAPDLGPPATSRSAKVARLSVAAAAMFMAIVTMFVYPGFLRHSSKPPVASQQDSSPLALRVENSGSELMLSWNRESSAIKNATKAVLAITDGAQHENVDMDLALLRSGTIEYAPSTSDVVFRMEVTGADQTKTASESVRILRTRPSPMPEPGQAAKSPKSAPAESAAKTATAASEATAPEAANGEEPAAPAEARAPAKAFNAESLSLSQRLRPVRPTDLPDAPDMMGRGSDAVSAPVPVGVASMPPPMLGSAPAAPAAVAPSAPARSANAATKGNGGQVQQAQLIHRTAPEYPAIARQSGAQGEVILTATIGVDGHVKDVKVVEGHPLLRNAAIAAVKQWVYKPTLLNGVATESETRISLNFVSQK